MIFSQRYKDLIEYGYGESKDYICGEISYDAREAIVDCLLEFDEPFIIHPRRYDPTYEAYSSALDEALMKQDKLVKTNIFSNGFDVHRHRHIIMATFAPHLFNIIELQYAELSDSEKTPFQQAINAVFADNDIPWIMTDGRLVKIDAKQFEIDLRNKALMALHELTDSDPKFQAAYDELIKACEYLDRGEFGEAISNAGKSYESILKVICNLQRGNADKLTKEYVTNVLDNLPASMTKEGFREKVLMALPFIRNNSSADHGAGATPAIISKPLAKLAINLAAALDTYLIEEYAADANSTQSIPVEGGGTDEFPF